MATEGSGAMFDHIAARYDLVNRLLSFGLDGGWRRKAAAALDLAPGARALDLAAGTADLTMAIARAQPAATVIGVDPSPEMLAIGRRKVAAAGLAERIVLREGAAEELPFTDGELDGAAIAFGIRNVADRARALAELRRVLRPGARLAVLELGEPRRGVLAPLARFHVRALVPRIGALVSGAPAEYRYLARSMARFPAPEAFAEELRAARFAGVEIAPLTAGVAHLFVAEAA